MSFIGGIAQAAGSVVSAGIQASAQNKATEAQEREANATLGFNQQVYGDQKANLAPYMQAGQNGLSQLVSGVGTVAPGSLTTANFANPNTGNANFSSTAAPVSSFSGNPQIDPSFSFTGQDLQNDPGYQFTLDQGIKANQRAASALGVSGGSAKALAQYTTGLANTTFNDAYNRALTTRQTNLQNQNQNFNQASQSYLNNLGGQQQQFNEDLGGFNANLAGYQANANNVNTNYNHLANIAGVGQTATQQLNTAGQQASTNYANAASAAANAQSAGSIATGNSIASGIQGATNSLANYLNYKAVFGGGGGTTMTPYTPTYPVNPATGL